MSLGEAIGAAAVVSVAAGWLVWLLIRREAGDHPLLRTHIIAVAVVVGVWAAVATPPSHILFATLILGWMLVALSAVDYLAFRLPDILTLPLIGCGLVISYWLPEPDVFGHLCGSVAGFVVLYAIAEAYRRTRGQEGLGLGDAKLAAAAGAWLGWQLLPSVLLIACAAGFVWVGIAVARRGKAALREHIPFGVPLCFAFWLVWLYGPPNFSRIA